MAAARVYSARQLRQLAFAIQLHQAETRAFAAERTGAGRLPAHEYQAAITEADRLIIIHITLGELFDGGAITAHPEQNRCRCTGADQSAVGRKYNIAIGGVGAVTVVSCGGLFVLGQNAAYYAGAEVVFKQIPAGVGAACCEQQKASIGRHVEVFDVVIRAADCRGQNFFVGCIGRHPLAYHQAGAATEAVAGN